MQSMLQLIAHVEFVSSVSGAMNNIEEDVESLLLVYTFELRMTIGNADKACIQQIFGFWCTHGCTNEDVMEVKCHSRRLALESTGAI